MPPSRSMESQKLINEKSLQRYVYETFTYGGSKIVKKFYPDKFIGFSEKRVKVIIPEFPIPYMDKNGDNKIHKTDFRIIYKDDSFLNVEIEWKTSRFNHGKEVFQAAYKGEKGFIIVLDDDYGEDYISKENTVEIDAEQFSFWFLRRAKHIVDGTISNYVSSYNSRSKKNWVIYLPKSGRKNGESESDYISKGRHNAKWAFRYSVKRPVMKNILEIMAGDTVIFVWGFEYGDNTKGREIYIDKEWSFTGLDILQVKNGYYCDFEDDTFETDG